MTRLPDELTARLAQGPVEDLVVATVVPAGQHWYAEGHVVLGWNRAGQLVVVQDNGQLFLRESAQLYRFWVPRQKDPYTEVDSGSV